MTGFVDMVAMQLLSPYRSFSPRRSFTPNPSFPRRPFFDPEPRAGDRLKADWTRHQTVAPFRRNDQLLEALPIGARRRGAREPQAALSNCDRRSYWATVGIRTSHVRFPGIQVCRATRLAAQKHTFSAVAYGDAAPCRCDLSGHTLPSASRAFLRVPPFCRVSPFTPRRLLSHAAHGAHACATGE
jgi:hypothetical protein